MNRVDADRRFIVSLQLFAAARLADRHRSGKDSAPMASAFLAAQTCNRPGSNSTQSTVVNWVDSCTSEAGTKLLSEATLGCNGACVTNEPPTITEDSASACLISAPIPATKIRQLTHPNKQSFLIKSLILLPCARAISLGRLRPRLAIVCLKATKGCKTEILGHLGGRHH
jgi:hypothetical protein